MNYKFVKYKKLYLKEAAKMMGETWSMDKHLKGLKDRSIIYSILFKLSYIDSDYCDMVVDKNGKLLGFLLAGKTEKSKHIGAGIEFIFNLIIGKFGKRINAVKVMLKMVKDFNEIMSDSINYDNEIKLFFVSEDARGLGLGKKMMNRYIGYCKKENIRNIILMTDEGCNYGFYDHYGFSQINRTHSVLFDKPEREYNGYAYAMIIK